jgi:hypothetical protein
MTDSPANFDSAPQPRRRRWFRRTVIGVVIVAVIGGAWLFLGEGSDVRRARNVQLGQTMDEVYAIMGREYALRFDGFGDHPMLLIGRVRYLQLIALMKIQEWTGWSGLTPNFDDWPVQIRFDQNGRVERIKRGKEIVEW